MAARAPKGTVKTAKPPAEKVNGQETAKAGPPTIREITNKVAKMGLEGHLRIFVRAGLMTEEEARTVLERNSKADRSKRGKRAAKKGGRTSSS